jgi:predicted transcriptional regulator
MDKSIRRVVDVMERDFDVMDGMATVAEALAVMSKNRAHSIIVAKRSEDDEFGILKIRDIAEHVLAPHRSPERTNVYEIMSKPALSVRPTMDIRYCARMFHRFGISAAPVIEGDEILGVVTYEQLVLKGLAPQA